MAEKDKASTTEVSIAADNETLQQLLHNLYSRYETGEVRAALEQTYSAVWNETEFDHTFDLIETTPPYVSVVNKETGQLGTLLYVDTPRFYFLLTPKPSHMKNSEEASHHFETGAVRSADRDDERWDLISPIGLKALAKTYAEGAAKRGAANWENGMPVTDLLNHAIAHLYDFLGGDRSEDHLGHAAWNVIGAIHSLEKWPELNEGLLRGPGCSCPPAAVKPRASGEKISLTKAEVNERLEAMRNKALGSNGGAT